VKVAAVAGRMDFAVRLVAHGVMDGAREERRSEHEMPSFNNKENAEIFSIMRPDVDAEAVEFVASHAACWMDCRMFCASQQAVGSELDAWEPGRRFRRLRRKAIGPDRGTKTAVGGQKTCGMEFRGRTLHVVFSRSDPDCKACVTIAAAVSSICRLSAGMRTKRAESTKVESYGDVYKESALSKI